jgi:signal peptidase I
MPMPNWRRIVLLTLSTAAVLLLPVYLRAYSVSGSSDAPTLLLGDTAIVNQAAYWVNIPFSQIRLLHVSRPKRGDLVQVLRPDRPLLAFKRVIGLPGETIEMHDNRVMIDGRAIPLKALPRGNFSWVSGSHSMGGTVYDEDGHWAAFTSGFGQYRDLTSVRLKGDEYFLLGDNRDVSLDCRAWGPLKENALFGKVIFALPTGPRKK